MTFLESILLGLIYGISDIMPIGSSGHMLFFAEIFNKGKIDLFYDILLHLATVVAIIIAFREDVINMVFEFFDMLKRIFANFLVFLSKKKGNTRYTYIKVINTSYKKLLVMIFISIIPTCVLGILGQGIVSLFNVSIWLVGICFILNAILVFIMDVHNESLDRITNVPYSSGFLVGVAQGISVVPGLSRTAMTVGMGIFLQFNKKLALKFSFLMAVPAILIEVILKLVNSNGASIVPARLPGYIVGMAVAIAVGVFSIKIILKHILRKKYYGFAIYSAVIGVAIIVYSIITK